MGDHKPTNGVGWYKISYNYLPVLRKSQEECQRHDLENSNRHGIAARNSLFKATAVTGEIPSFKAIS